MRVQSFSTLKRAFSHRRRLEKKGILAVVEIWGKRYVVKWEE